MLQLLFEAKFKFSRIMIHKIYCNQIYYNIFNITAPPLISAPALTEYRSFNVGRSLEGAA